MNKQRLFSKNLVMLSLCTFVVWVIMMSVYPISPTLIGKLHTNVSVFGRIVGAASFLMLLMNIVSGMLSDKIGRKPCVIIGVVLVLCSTFMIWMSNSAMTFYIAWLIGGCGRGIFLSPAFSMVGEMYEQENRGKAMAFLSVSISVGSVAGYLISGVVTELYGWKSLYGILIIGMSLCLLGTGILSETKDENTKDVPVQIGNFSFVKEFIRPIILLCSLISILGFTAATGVNFILPYMAQSNDISIVNMSVILIPYEVIGMIANIIVGSISDKIGRKLPLLVILFLAVTANSLLVITGDSFLKVLVLFSVLSFCEGPLIGVTTTIVIDYIKVRKPENLGSVMGGYRSLYSLGSVIGPWLAGIMLNGYGCRDSLIAMGICIALAFVFGVFIKIEKQGDQNEMVNK